MKHEQYHSLMLSPTNLSPIGLAVPNPDPHIAPTMTAFELVEVVCMVHPILKLAYSAYGKRSSRSVLLQSEYHGIVRVRDVGRHWS